MKPVHTFVIAAMLAQCGITLYWAGAPDVVYWNVYNSSGWAVAWLIAWSFFSMTRWDKFEQKAVCFGFMVLIPFNVINFFFAQGSPLWFNISIPVVMLAACVLFVYQHARAVMNTKSHDVDKGIYAVFEQPKDFLGFIGHLIQISYHYDLGLSTKIL